MTKLNICKRIFYTLLILGVFLLLGTDSSLLYEKPHCQNPISAAEMKHQTSVTVQFTNGSVKSWKNPGFKVLTQSQFGNIFLTIQGNRPLFSLYQKLDTCSTFPFHISRNNPLFVNVDIVGIKKMHFCEKKTCIEIKSFEISNSHSVFPVVPLLRVGIFDDNIQLLRHCKRHGRLCNGIIHSERPWRIGRRGWSRVINGGISVGRFNGVSRSKTGT